MPRDYVLAPFEDGSLATWGGVHLSWALLVSIGLVERPAIGDRVAEIVIGAFFSVLLLAGAIRVLSVYGYGLLAFLELGNVVQIAFETSYFPPYTFAAAVDDGVRPGLLVVNAAVVVLLVTRTMHLARERDGWWPVSLF